MRKRYFKTYADCELAYRAADSDRTIQGMFINAILNDEPCVKLRRGAYTARLIRADSACGGIVGITFRCEGQADYTSVYYVDNWAPHYRDSFPDPKNKEGVDLQLLAYDVLRERNTALSKSA